MAKSARPRADPAEARAQPGAGARAKADAVLDIRVIPRSPRTRVDGMRGRAVLIRLAAPPVDGSANAALVDFLADALDLPRRDVAIVGGERSRDKRVRVVGFDRDAAIARLLA